MADRTGQTFGNYRLLRLLGTGGFAEVYVAEHVHLPNRTVAIKILHAFLSQSEHKNFLQEARTIDLLQHEGIIKLLDFGIVQNCAYMVMPYYQQGTLRDKHPRGTIVPIEDVVTYVKQIAEALQFAHDHQLIHRDLKPENILVDGNTLLLSDFGIATIARNTARLDAQPDLYIGTPPYSAPEQIQGKARIASDQYALAIIVYEWLTGERPFLGASETLQYQHLVSTPPPMKGVSPAVEKVVMKALEKDPHQRFSRIKAFAIALEEAMNEVSTAVQPLILEEETIIVQPKEQVIEINKPLLTFRGHTDKTRAVVWSPDGNYIASGSEDGAVHVWKALTGILCWSYSEDINDIPSMTWSPDSRYLAVGCDRTVYVFDALTGSSQCEYSEHTDTIWSVAWSPDGRYIASGSLEFTDDIHVWDALTGNELYKSRGGFFYVYSVIWSPDSKYIAVSGMFNVEVWEALTGTLLLTYSKNRGSVNNSTWSPDGKYIASAGEDIHVWEALTGISQFTYAGHKGNVWSVAWSHDGKHIASAGEDGTVQILNSLTGISQFMFSGYKGSTFSISWSPDSRYIASGNEDGTVLLWELPK